MYDGIVPIEINRQKSTIVYSVPIKSKPEHTHGDKKCLIPAWRNVGKTHKMADHEEDYSVSQQREMGLMSNTSGSFMPTAGLVV